MKLDGRVVAGLYIAGALGLILLQLVLFAPVVAAGRALDAGPFRVDGLSLVAGVVWALCLGLATSRSRPGAVAQGLLAVGLFAVCYAREPWLLYAGWEVAGLGVLALLRVRAGDYLLPAAFVLPGLPLLIVIVLGEVEAFAPPPGGAAQAWSLAFMLAIGLAVVARSVWLPLRVWPLAGSGSEQVLGLLYVLAGPLVLARALVAAPWSPWGTWLLALAGTVGLILAAWAALLGGRTGPTSIAAAHASATISGLGLGAASPLAAAGAVALIVIGVLWAAALGGHVGRAGLAVLLLGDGLGVWLLAQGALNTGYGIVAAVAVPALGLVVLACADPAVREARGGTGLWRGAAAVGVSFLVLTAVYPQMAVEALLRPAIGAMAGGVGTLSALQTAWGAGLRVSEPGGALLAALPATGIGVAVLFAFAVLYWLKQLLGRWARDPDAPILPE